MHPGRRNFPSGVYSAYRLMYYIGMDTTTPTAQTFCFSHELRYRLVDAIVDAKANPEDRRTKHAYFLDLVQHTKPGQELPVDHEIAVALFYYDIKF